MAPPDSGPFLFDTSAESWLANTRHAAAHAWMQRYLETHAIHVSAICVLERIRGYALRWRIKPEDQRADIEAWRRAYLSQLGPVLATDSAAAVAAGDIMGLVPSPPTLPRRRHREFESRQDRLARWRFDCIIAATALVSGMPLIHNNAADFEAIRDAIDNSPEHFPGRAPLQLIDCASLL